MSKKVYTEDDIYEGMILECVGCISDIWRIGKQYIVDKNLCIYDEDNDKRDIRNIVNRLNNPNERVVILKVVEPEEEHQVLQLSNYYFGLKTGDNKKHITIPAYNTQQAIEYLTNELEYYVNDIVSLEVK